MDAKASVEQIFGTSPREAWYAELGTEGAYDCQRKIEGADAETVFHERLFSALDAVAFFAAGREAAYFPARDFIDALDDQVIPDQSGPTQPPARSELSWTPSSC
jgi:hypothetical protein